MKPPPSPNPSTEMHALQRRSEYYEAKVAALLTKRPKSDLIKREIKYVSDLNRQCQGAIAFYLSRAIRPVE